MIDPCDAMRVPSALLVVVERLLDWVAVGLGADLRRGMAMPARINGVDLAVWRAASGRVHAWGDRCPHRGMRLSHGFVRGETLSCIYHGWQYDDDGGCSYIPAHPDLTPPKTICATTYGCRDSDGLIWVALRDTAGVPPSLPGKVPVRSINVRAPITAVAAHFGDPDKSVIHTGQPDETTVVLQPTDPAHCMIHALTRSDRKSASRWLEDQRNRIEGVPA